MFMFMLALLPPVLAQQINPRPDRVLFLFPDETEDRETEERENEDQS
jgi:hypothetical protein